MKQYAIVEYLRKLTLGGTKEESSKRFMAMYVLIGIMTPISIAYTTGENLVMVLGIYSTLIVSLAVTSTTETIKTNNKPKNEEE